MKTHFGKYGFGTFSHPNHRIIFSRTIWGHFNSYRSWVCMCNCINSILTPYFRHYALYMNMNIYMYRITVIVNHFKIIVYLFYFRSSCVLPILYILNLWIIHKLNCAFIRSENIAGPTQPAPSTYTTLLHLQTLNKIKRVEWLCGTHHSITRIFLFFF